MDGNNRPQLGVRTSGDVGSPQHDFGGIKPRDYNYTGMQAAGDVAGQLLRVGKPFAEATKINMGIERHERDMAGKERIRSLVVATQQLGGIMSRATPNNAHIFEEINKTPEAQEFIGGQLKVRDAGETRGGNPLYFFNILDPKTGESINEIQATTAEAVNMFDGMLAPEMQRHVRETSRTSAKARKRIKDVLEKYSTKEGNIIDLVAEGIELSHLQQEVLDNIFLHGSKSQQEIAAQLISDQADENELKKKRAVTEEKRKVSREERAAAEEEREVSREERAAAEPKETQKDKDLGLSFTEKERYKSAGKELTGLQIALADPFTKATGDPEAKKIRVGELKDLMKELESKESGVSRPDPDGGETDPRQAILRQMAQELRAKFPSASPGQLKELLKLKTGAYGEGEEAQEMLERIMDELETRPQMDELETRPQMDTEIRQQSGLGEGGREPAADYLDRYQRPQRPRWGHVR